MLFIIDETDTVDIFILSSSFKALQELHTIKGPMKGL